MFVLLYGDVKYVQEPHNSVTFELDHDFFDVTTDGGIFLKRSLLQDSSSSYRVSKLDIFFC